MSRFVRSRIGRKRVFAASADFLRAQRLSLIDKSNVGIYHGIYHAEDCQTLSQRPQPGCPFARRIRFEGSEVYVRRDPGTGDVILSRRPESWEDLFALMKTVEIPEEFLADRKDTPPQKRRLF